MSADSTIGDFTLAGYERLLTVARQSGYAFGSFADVGRETWPRICLLRHDIDNELLHCGPMLDIERRQGVQATYFVMLRATAYNLLCVEAIALVRRIVSQGHWLGLHFMGERFEESPAETIVAEVQREAAWLTEEFGAPVRAVSFHQPTRRIMEGNIVVPGMVNTYNKAQLAAYHYVSDSNMDWRGQDPSRLLSQGTHPRLQMLIHPMWWTERPMTALSKWQAVLQMNQKATANHWQDREVTLRGARVPDKGD